MLNIYNTLSRQKEEFKSINKGHVGLYVCGPTVYGEAHLGHARSAITFDILFRYLLHLGYKVRYVRNITDVGHLENDADSGEDKIEKKARLEQLEPMEVAGFYTQKYLQAMDSMNVKRPSIQPLASGHIIEQIEIVKKILAAGYAYIENGSVYFDLLKYQKDTGKYGCLSHRVIEDMLQTTRDLNNQEEKHNSCDFALWKKASAEHIMKWTSEWSEGFPGWHLECTAMSAKYLGVPFDIHGGGMDLIFPHHESEIAQCQCAFSSEPCHYWMHNNMITVDGRKMGKSLGNFITLSEFFSGKHDKLAQAYSPMTIRFFILSAHYRSTLDFSNEALQAAEKGFKRLCEAKKTISSLSATIQEANKEANIQAIKDKCADAMDDDLNTPIVISYLFEAASIVNKVAQKFLQLNQEELDILKEIFSVYFTDVLGLEDESQNQSNGNLIQGLIDMILEERKGARQAKDWTKSDQIRDALLALGIEIKDSKDGVTYTIK